MESYRNVLKELVRFAKREYREKKPDSVKVLRTKNVRFLTLGGAFKTYSLRKAQNPPYMIIVEYKERLRLYLFTKEGILIEGINQHKNPKFLKELKRSSITEYKFPK